MNRKNLFTLLLIACATIATAQSNSPTIVIETSHGTMKAVLYDDTPVHRDHYLKLIKEGYFDGTLFHRVVEDFVIQGGAQDSRNAPPGMQIGSGSREMELAPEFRENRYHKKGALAAPRRGDDENPQKRSDASQFYIVHGQKFTEGRLDTMEMVVNVPIRNEIIRTHYAPHREELARLKESGEPREFNALLDSVLGIVDSLYALAPGKLILSEELKSDYSTLGGMPQPGWGVHRVWGGDERAGCDRPDSRTAGG